MQAGKYARVELERRFLLAGPPAGLEAGGWRIADRYIDGTRLRLRRMDPLAGGEPVLKLGQKEAPAAPDFTRTTITNLYLTPREYELLAALPARPLRKRRHTLREAGRTYAVDLFEGDLDGLVLAELELPSAAALAADSGLPSFALRDVSADVRYTGGALAAATRAQAAELAGRPA